MLAVVRSAVPSVYGDVQLATSDQFCVDSDNIAVRSTFRFGQKISDTARVVSLTTPGS